MTEETKEIHPDDLAIMALEEAHNVLFANKPKERGELARRYAVAMTELEKVMGYVDTFIRKREYWPKGEA